MIQEIKKNGEDYSNSVNLNSQQRNITGLKKSTYGKLKIKTGNADTWNQRLRSAEHLGKKRSQSNQSWL